LERGPAEKPAGPFLLRRMKKQSAFSNQRSAFFVTVQPSEIDQREMTNSE
jgi:hypothetical protein